MLRGHVTAQKGVGFASRKATQQGQEWCLSSSCTRQAMYTPPLPPLPLTPTPFPKLPLSPPQLPPPLVPPPPPPQARPRIEPGRRHQCTASLLHCCRRPLACARVVCVLRACKCLCVRVCLCAMVCVAPRRVGSRRAASRRVGSGRAVPHRVGSDYHNAREREREEREREERERETLRRRAALALSDQQSGPAWHTGHSSSRTRSAWDLALARAARVALPYESTMPRRERASGTCARGDRRARASPYRAGVSTGARGVVRPDLLALGVGG